MAELKKYIHNQFGEIRTVEESNKVLFCGSDVAKALGYDQPHKAIERHCRYGTKHTIPHPQSASKTIDMLFVPEGDVYRLITHSKLPAAEQFERWVFDEVLPTIRKNGAYMTDETLEQALTSPDFLIQLATKLKEEKEKRMALENKVEQDKPKVLFADAVTTAKTSILIGDLAKILKQNGVDTGQKRLFEQLRVEGFLMKEGSSRNMPTQRAMEQGLFEVKETVVNNPDGSTRVTRTTKVTGKGQVYFVQRFMQRRESME